MLRCDVCGGSLKYINIHTAKCEYCGRLFQVNGDSLSEANIESLYQEAFVLFNRQSEEDILSAIEIFEELGSYKDSPDKVYEGKNKLYRVRADEADRKIEEQRQRELAEIQRKKRENNLRKKSRIVSIISAVMIVAVATVVVTVSVNKNQKNNKYQEAVVFFNQGDYENAAELLESLGDYKDSADYLSIARENISTRKEAYNKGVAYYNEGLYLESIGALSEIVDYLDSNEYIEKAATKLYEQSEQFFNGEEYEKAKDTLRGIPETSGSYIKAVALLKQVDERLIELQNMQKYEIAVSAYESGEYERSQKKFLEIREYLDSNEYLTDIGTALLQNAKNEFELQNYDEGVRIIHLIDESVEWSEYDEAKSYLESMTEEYKNESIEMAKETYKSQGESAMNDYLSSRVCSLFAQSDANNIKNDIVAMYIPTRLTECVVLEDESLDGDMTINPEDIFKNVYEYGIKYFDPYLFYFEDMNVHETYTTYYLDKPYVHFSATIVPYGSGGNPAQFSIYADGVSKYSCSVSDTSRPQVIDIDISGAEEIKIGFFGGYLGHFLLADPYLYENY